MKNTRKGFIVHHFYNLPIIGYIIGKMTDDYFYNSSNLVLDSISQEYEDAINAWVTAHPNEILTNKKVQEIVKNIKDL